MIVDIQAKQSSLKLGARTASAHPRFLDPAMPACTSAEDRTGGLFWTNKLGKIATLQEKQKTFLGQMERVTKLFY